MKLIRKMACCLVKKKKINSGVMEVTKCNTQRWFHHLEKMDEKEIGKTLYKSRGYAVGGKIM